MKAKTQEAAYVSQQLGGDDKPLLTAVEVVALLGGWIRQRTSTGCHNSTFSRQAFERLLRSEATIYKQRNGKHASD
ncbi:MAG: hypothetical protein LC541_04520 [Candidatus Thiodiazotropha sp.]|nr:hypothetical protein [Candidatus Thiodiazotropha sp.]MCM8882581.1 hypothetical protein [Candidatus Thiodiazotropha sp.]MCM8918772.1 hypothetical protein [Candidatus Thiodiazotropha sp.]